MKKNENTWQSLSIPFNPGLHEAITQHHHAAQFLSMVGKQLVPQRENDSHTAMQYHPQNQMLAGEEIVPGLRLTLRLSEFSLGILKNGILSESSVSLLGLNQSNAFIKMSHMLISEGIKTNDLRSELHHDMPDHELLNGASFKESEAQFLQEYIKYRHNPPNSIQCQGQGNSFHWDGAILREEY